MFPQELDVGHEEMRHGLQTFFLLSNKSKIVEYNGKCVQHPGELGPTARHRSWKE